MFTHISLKNFKAWRDELEIKLAPITVLLGTNSSGKSTILQALLLLKQTAASPDRNIHLNLGGNEVNDYFNFGRFSDVLSHDVSPRRFNIGFKFKRQADKSGAFFAQYAFTKGGKTAIQELKLESGQAIYHLIRGVKGSYELRVGTEQQSKGKSSDFAPERSIALSADALQCLSPEDKKQAEDMSLNLRRELEAIAYLGPLRKRPERHYIWNKTCPRDMEIDGGNVVQSLLASYLLSSLETRHSKPLHEQVSFWLNKMGIADKLEIKQSGRYSSHEIIVHKGEIASNLHDVGFGISQVLPVLTLAYFVPEYSTILLEEPEIHLHPLAQSILAELLVEVSQKRHLQFIVETHSEHLFRRLQTLVASEKLAIKDCCLYFVERENTNSTLQELCIDRYGRIKNWPEKFFGDALGETREQARLMFEHQLRDCQTR